MMRVIVTEDLARRWVLRQTPHHHPKRAEAVAQFARQMANGFWVCLGHHPIVFNDAGQLIDGRCRVEAVVMARMPVQLYVTGWTFTPSSLEDPDIA